MRGLRYRSLRRHSKKLVLLAVSGVVALGLIGGGAYAALGGPVRPSASGNIELQRGLVGHWKLDGHAKDATPYARNGTVNGATLTNDRKVASNKAYSFNGTSNYIDTSLAMTNFAEGFTWSYWARTSAFSGSWMWPVSASLVASPWLQCGKVSGSGQIRFDTTFFSSGVSVDTTDVNIADNQWHHVDCVWDKAGGQKYIYVDGVLEAQQAAATTDNFSSYGVLRIGAHPGPSQFWNGQIDDVRAYNRAISLAEAKALHEQYDTAPLLGSGQGGLVGYWKMDGNAKDATPSANSGTVTGATLTTDRKGSANRAYSFNGSTNYLTVPHNAVIKPTQAITVSWWVAPSNITSTATQKMLSATEGGSYSSAITGSTADTGCLANSVCFFLNIAGTYRVVQTSRSVLSNGVWAHIAATYNGSSLTLYVNGSAVQSGSYTGAITQAGAPLCLGVEAAASACTSGQFFAGSLDDVRIYGRGLSAQEISAQANSYDSQINLNAAPTNTTSGGNINSGLMGYWPFNGNPKDATPYAGNGTLVNAPTLTTDRRGRASSAYNFTAASSQHMTVPDSPQLSPTTAVSVSVWFKGTVANTSYASSGSVVGIVNKDIGGSSAQNPIYGFQVVNGTLAFTSTSSTNVFVQSVYGGLADDTWYHAVGTYDGSNIRLYVNGVLRDTDPQVTLDDSTGLLRVGMQKSGFVRYFNGVIDEVRVWNRTLSLGEVQTLYNSQN